MIITKNYAIVVGLLAFFVACSNSQETVRKSKALIPNCVFGVKSVSYNLYTRDNVNGVNVYQQDSSIPLRPGRVVFVIHGFLAQANSSEMYGLIDALLEQEDINVFSVNWDDAACAGGLIVTDFLSYGSALKNVPVVGENVAEFSLNLAENYGILINETMLIGFSLGAHIAGFAAKHVQRMSGRKYNAIIGLDAAGPGFQFTSCDRRLCIADATRVIAMHTSVPVGLHAPIGHVDFYFNNGINQPDCYLTPVCNHGKVVEYATNFIRNPDCYLGTRWQLDSLFFLSADLCDGNNCAYAGLSAIYNDAQGIYNVKTSSNAPYCNV